MLTHDETLPDRFKRAAQSNACRAAVASETSRSTYGELDAASDVWAQAIVGRGGNPGDRVVILMRHDPHQVAAVLAVLKAGRIVVVVNPTDPSSRLRLTVEDAAPKLIIADAAHMQSAHEIAQGCACVRCDDLNLACINGSTLHLDPEATAFIVYTSGSAGRPKGVMINHKQIAHNAVRLSSAMVLSADDRIALEGYDWLTASAATATMPGISTTSPASKCPISRTCRANSAGSAFPRSDTPSSPTATTFRPYAARSTRSGTLAAGLGPESGRRAQLERYAVDFDPVTGNGGLEIWIPVRD